MPATPPTVITVPIIPLCQPCASRNTPRNGPMPDCMSAMKKFSASSGQTPLEAPPRAGLFDGRVKMALHRRDWRWQITLGDRVGSPIAAARPTAASAPEAAAVLAVPGAPRRARDELQWKAAAAQPAG